MKWIFLLIVVPIAIVAQDQGIEPIASPIAAKQSVPPKYSWIAVHNGIIMKGFDFNVAIRRFGSTSKNIYLTLTLAGVSESGVQYLTRKYAHVKKGRTSDWVSFKTAGIPKGSYTLQIEGDGYDEKRQLHFSSKDAIMIQLEKSIFSPGQTVRFRIFAIDALTNAVSPSSACSMTIKDVDGNLIEEFNNLSFLKGKYENKLVLGDKAAQGIWRIEVTCGDWQWNEDFEVAEYKLPPFEVTLTTPFETSFSNLKVPVHIKATYSFGKPVDGTGSLEISQQYPNNLVLTRAIVIAGGEASFDLDIVSDLKAKSNEWSSYSYKLTVTDSIMKQEVTLNTDELFYITPNKYFITVSGSHAIAPGSTYSYSVVVANKANQFPAQGTKVTVNINLGVSTLTQTLTLNAVGSASSSFKIPSGATTLSIEAEAPESSLGYLYGNKNIGIPGSVSLFPNYRDETKSVKINEWFDIQAIVGDNNVDWIAYFVVSKGILLESQKVYLSSTTRSATIWIKPTIEHFPSFSVFAVYVKGSDIIVDEVSVKVRGGLNNFVKLDFKEVTVKPGANFKFTVDSKCDSTVSFTAIDQRVLQLRSDNEILYNDVVRVVNPFLSDWVADDRQNIPSYEWSFKDDLVYIQTNIPPPPPQPGHWIKRTIPSEEAKPAVPGIKIRKDFSETFCWTDVVTNKDAYHNNCRAKVRCKVPESITKYLVYPVSMNDEYGIGLLDTPANITAFLSFFINCDVPETIHRNELLTLNIPIFNYINKNQMVTVTITKSNKFAASSLAVYGWTETATGYEKVVSVLAGKSFNDIYFDLTFLEIGIFPIKIVAKGPLAGDGIEKLIHVIPEGLPRSITKSVLILGNSPADTYLTCVYPDGTYDDTKQVLSTVIGDILGKALDNLGNLIQMPWGCGEQNLITVVPNCAIYDYLKVTGKLTPAIETKLKEYQAIGVQNQLSFRRLDGSFSSWGNKDPEGSTWLTIYTVFAFFKAKEYVNVNSAVIASALDFVIGKQQPDGSFAELGKVNAAYMQGGSGIGVGMTAYISSVLTPMLNEYPLLSDARDKANAYLVLQLPTTEDVYQLGIIAYALLLAGDAAGPAAFVKFFDKRTEVGEEIYWEIQPTQSLNVEASAYGLLNLILRDDKISAIKVVRYLIGQSSKFGGYGSSQETVMSILALAEFAKSFELGNANMELTLTPNSGTAFTTKINSNNAMTLQQFELDSNANSLNVKPSSSNIRLAIVSLTCNFYQNAAAVIPDFDVTYKYSKECRWFFVIDICASYIPSGTSNMAIITVYLPSGFQYDGSLKVSNPNVSKVETFNAGTKVVFYFNTIGNTPQCVRVGASLAQMVNQLLPGVIIVNDYYDTSKEGTAKFPPPDVNGAC